MPHRSSLRTPQKKQKENLGKNFFSIHIGAFGVRFIRLRLGPILEDPGAPRLDPAYGLGIPEIFSRYSRNLPYKPILSFPKINLRSTRDTLVAWTLSWNCSARKVRKIVYFSVVKMFLFSIKNTNFRIRKEKKMSRVV